MVGDRRLMRFLRGRQNNVDLAAGMFKEHLKWRKTFHTNEIRNRIAFGGLNHPYMFPCGEKYENQVLYSHVIIRLNSMSVTDVQQF